MSHLTSSCFNNTMDLIWQHHSEDWNCMGLPLEFLFYSKASASIHTGLLLEQQAQAPEIWKQHFQ